ncbi:MAG: class I SAM-dependent methyltransferase [Anaerolineae bacterium]
MNRRFNPFLQAIYARWPEFGLRYGGMVAALIVLGVSARRGWWSYVPLSLAALVILSYFLLGNLWVMSQVYGRTGLNPHQVLFDMGRVQPTDGLVFIDVGWRHRSIAIAGRLTTGQTTIVDVYSPQWAASRALARWRSRLPQAESDPRIFWRNGAINLLPLPDASVTTVMMCQVLAEFWQRGDQLTLLQEIRRILTPDGRLLLAEPIRSQTTWIALGAASLHRKAAPYWQNLLVEAGFHIRAQKGLAGIIQCYQADRPSPEPGYQLSLDLVI